MTEEDVRKAISEALRKIAPEADLASVRPDQNLREALDIDSFDFLNFLIGLHQRLGVEIPEADYGKLATLANLISYLLAAKRQ